MARLHTSSLHEASLPHAPPGSQLLCPFTTQATIHRKQSPLTFTTGGAPVTPLAAVAAPKEENEEVGHPRPRVNEALGREERG